METMSKARCLDRLEIRQSMRFFSCFFSVCLFLASFCPRKTSKLQIVE